MKNVKRNRYLRSIKNLSPRTVKILVAVAFVALILYLIGWYGPIRGTVIDAETGKPIEGAIVMASWTRTFGLGHTHQDHYKAVEAVTDKDGKFWLPGCYCFYVNRPEMVVYKFGYVAWRNDSRFGGTWGDTLFYRSDKEKYKSGLVCKLEKFKEGYSRSDHYSFMDSGLSGSLSETPRFNEAIGVELHLGQEEIRRGKDKSK